MEGNPMGRIFEENGKGSGDPEPSFNLINIPERITTSRI
jgi:hypothetical protein